MENSLFVLALQGWTPSGDQAVGRGFEFLGLAGAALLGLVFLFFVVRAWSRRARYRAVESFTEADVSAVREALVEAEKRTVGEILPVVVERSDPHPGAAWIAALFTLVTGSILLAGFLPWDRPGLLLSCQLLLGGVGWASAWFLADFRRLFISEERATKVAAEQAFQEFYQNGLHRTEAATGVLLFVSLLERRVIVMGDEGINARVTPEDWEATDRAILDGIRQGSLRAGLLAGIEAAAELLAEHFPWADGDRNEIPDRVIVRFE